VGQPEVLPARRETKISALVALVEPVVEPVLAVLVA
jgi:uncharacterized membrane protein